MKHNTLNRWISVCSMALIATMLMQSGWAQTPEEDDLFEPRTKTKQRVSTSAEAPIGRPANDLSPWYYGGSGGGFVAGGGGKLQFRLNERRALEPKIQQAVEALRNAEDAEAKSEAEVKLRQALTDYFDEDMKRRESQLAEMRDKLAKLEKQLEQRSEKREDIVDLQAQVLINQANGFGFFSDATGSPGTRADVVYFEPPSVGNPNPFAKADEATIAAPVPVPAPDIQPAAPPQPAEAPVPAKERPSR